MQNQAWPAQGPEGGEAVFLDGEGNIVFPGGYVEKGFMNADIHALELFPRGAPPTPTLVKVSQPSHPIDNP